MKLATSQGHKYGKIQKYFRSKVYSYFELDSDDKLKAELIAMNVNKAVLRMYILNPYTGDPIPLDSFTYLPDTYRRFRSIHSNTVNSTLFLRLSKCGNFATIAEYTH